MVLRPLFNTETTLIWYCYHSIMVLRPLKYGVTTILTLSSPKLSIWYYDHENTVILPFKLFNFSSNRNILKEYLYIFKIIFNFDRTFIVPNGPTILKVLLFWRVLHYRRDYVFKTFLNFEGMLYRIGTNVLINNTLIFEGRREKEFSTTQ